jgi:hypothetical protein
VRTTSGVRAFPRESLRGRRLHWLVTVEWAGQTWRVSSDEREVLTADGDVLRFADGLEPLSVMEEMELGGDAVATTSATVEAFLPCDVPRLVALGHTLARAWVEVSRWVEGTTWEERLPLVAGYPTDAAYSERERITRLSVRTAVGDDARQIPEATAQVDSSTWAQTEYIGSFDYGLPYPIIIGKPGIAAHLTVGHVGGSRVAWVDKATQNHKCIIAGHPVTATQVILCTPDDRTGLRFACATTTDLRGRQVTIITGDYPASDTTDSLESAPLDVYYSGLEHSTMVPGSAILPPVADDLPLYVAWRDLTDPAAGGAVSLSGETLRGAGEVLVYLLGYTSIQPDASAFGGVAAALDGYKIDAAIDARVPVWEWVTQHLLPILPVSLRATPFGVAPVLWDIDPASTHVVAVMDFDADPRLTPDEEVVYELEPITNRVVVRYTYDRCGGQHQSTVTVAPESDGTTANLDASPLARISRDQLADRDTQDDGVREKSVDTDVVYERATAFAIGHHILAREALPRRLYNALAPEDEWAWLSLGNPVALTYAGHNLAGHRAILVGREWGDDGQIGLRFRMYERPAADLRLTAAGDP